METITHQLICNYITFWRSITMTVLYRREKITNDLKILHFT